MKFNEARKIKQAIIEYQAVIDGFIEIAGTMAVNHFTRSFRNQGFTDEHLEKWKPRKRNSYRTRSGKTVDDTSRAILVGKGTAILMKSLVKRRIDKYSTRITSSGRQKDYAGVHNWGLRSGRGHGFIMPQRQFVGDSGVLNRAILAKLHGKIRKIFNN